jgi:hypothetical protein
MRVLGLEISDAGIMAAEARSGKLLKVDGESLESPGVALLDKKKRLVGGAADRLVCRSPRLVNNAFWDLLDGSPLSQPGYEGITRADLVYGHLKEIWRAVRPHGDEVIMAVPSYFTQEQLGYILGMTSELSMPVRGFVTLAAASAPEPVDSDLIVHVDLSLHRVLITFLEPGERLTQTETLSLQARGMIELVSEWKKSIAGAFVQQTRFDPLYDASSEQELHDRLPALLANLQDKESVPFEMKSGLHKHVVTLTRDLFAEKSAPVFADVAAAVESKRAKAGLRGATTALCLTHRVTRIPGWKESLALLPHTRLFALEPGAGAKGAAKLANLFEDPSAGKSVVLLASRPWHGVSRGVEDSPESPEGPDRPPTHVLHGAVAYPISASPLVVSSEKGNLRLVLLKENEHPASGHCTIRREGKQVVLTNLSPSGTLLDGVRITGSAPLSLGQRIRVGESEETLQLIACLNKDEA